MHTKIPDAAMFQLVLKNILQFSNQCFMSGKKKKKKKKELLTHGQHTCTGECSSTRAIHIYIKYYQWLSWCLKTYTLDLSKLKQIN